MSTNTVLTLVGSLRAGSTNAQLAEAIQLNAPEQVEVLFHESTRPGSPCTTLIDGKRKRGPRSAVKKIGHGIPGARTIARYDTDHAVAAASLLGGLPWPGW
ncbi:hypothetical protein SAMN04487914_14621 [Arthrobacter sp. ok909]|nr:hypothetical protein SAMN04487914_14621 [Arthrobacter sp. ok909]